MWSGVGKRWFWWILGYLVEQIADWKVLPGYNYYYNNNMIFKEKRRLEKIRAPDGIWTHDPRMLQPTRSRRVVGSNPIWGSDFSPRISCCCCSFPYSTLVSQPIGKADEVYQVLTGIFVFFVAPVKVTFWSSCLAKKISKSLATS